MKGGSSKPRNVLRARGSEALELEAIEMQYRLQDLRERSEESNNLDENRRTNWKSAQRETGSVTRYGKELHQTIKYKIKSRLEKPSLSISARPIENTKTKDNFNISSWLETVGLIQYLDTFKRNEIDEFILPTLTPSDLDYLGVTVLKHRKIIFHAIETMKVGKEIASKTHKGDKLNCKTTSDILNLSEAPQLVKHTLPNERLTADFDDTIDEEAERLAFQAAVMEWRQRDCADYKTKSSNDKNIPIIREYESKSKKDSHQVIGFQNLSEEGKGTFHFNSDEPHQQSTWVNPFTSLLLDHKIVSTSSAETSCKITPLTTAADAIIDQFSKSIDQEQNERTLQFEKLKQQAIFNICTYQNATLSRLTIDSDICDVVEDENDYFEHELEIAESSADSDYLNTIIPVKHLNLAASFTRAVDSPGQHPLKVGSASAESSALRRGSHSTVSVTLVTSMVLSPQCCGSNSDESAYIVEEA